MKEISPIRTGLRQGAARFALDRSGLAAVEFAFIVPLMLVMLFGIVEFSSAVAASRKVTLMARTLSDLTSRAPQRSDQQTVADADLANFVNAGIGIMTPFTTAQLKSTITELWIDPNSLAARVQWSKGDAPRATSTTVQVPSALQIAGTYLIFSEVSYNYIPSVGAINIPTIGPVMPTGIALRDVAYTRPRYSLCVIYPTPAPNVAMPNCPKL
ncbi:TadE/TadG family type IV pilus assembly protein [Bradyrhizobium lablabi]|uniref:TadE/TadG family type IV pilus assembly protein n=1 Tax=Bradyrhizobium lablabi TaxID=722472 RepID=UPI001BABE3A1|nr:TadE/TadG family type IV pilus assembly protein [Bradyrhizobium lablabi]MBR0691836.1 pilus assembly protein [Bradyrhizobium lablabi]